MTIAQGSSRTETYYKNTGTISDEPEEHVVALTDYAAHAKERPTRSWRNVFISMCGLSLLGNISAGIWYMHVRTLRNDVDSAAINSALVTAEPRDMVCTNCTDLGIPTGTVGDLHGISVYHVTDAMSLCCLNNKPGLLRLLELFTDRSLLANQLKQPTDTFVGSTGRGSGAHLYLNRERLDSHPPVLRWTEEYGYGSAYRSPDVSNNGHRLHVARAGIYHIYSFLTFKTSQQRQAADIVLHTVSRDNKRLESLGAHVMLMAKKTLPASSGKFVTSYLSATVRLRKFDNIFVEVSNASRVYGYSPSNFFGLFFISA